MVKSSTWAPSAEDDRKEDSLMIEESREDLWEGSPLQIGRGVDPHSTEEIVIESDAGDEEVLKLKLGEEFISYEPHQAGIYIDTLVHDIQERLSPESRSSHTRTQTDEEPETRHRAGLHARSFGSESATRTVGPLLRA